MALFSLYYFKKGFFSLIKTDFDMISVAQFSCIETTACASTESLKKKPSGISQAHDASLQYHFIIIVKLKFRFT